MESNGLLTVKEAATLLNITQLHLRRLINKNIIPSVNLAIGKVRKTLRIEKRVIEEFIAKGGITSE